MVLRLLQVGLGRLRHLRLRPPPTLTRKEQTIAEWFVGGQTVHEIAKGAGLATRGIELTLERVAEKLQLPNREDLSFLARSAPGEITRSRQALGRALRDA
jgi:DNA-binding CsgD family transcriptional regulator